MELLRLQLFNYKNHGEKHLEFSPDINCIAGRNGCGKTNILDAVYLLANAKSYFNSIDQQLIRHGEDFFSVHGWFHDETDFDVLANFSNKGKKTLKKNDKTYSRLIDHIGWIQTVFITPYDISLVLEGGEERRRFLDFTICQTDREYLEVLNFYRKIIDQRNKYLKSNTGRMPDPDILESYDHRLIPTAKKIFETRKKFIEIFLPFFHEMYDFVSDKNEHAGIAYQSELEEKDYANILKENSEKDRILQRTCAGIHKDDLSFDIDNFPLKKYGSQGQIKSFVIALKLAQYKFLAGKTHRKPILLLDDIFEKIDADRAGKLMELMQQDMFGQIFITDTHIKRVKEHLKKVDREKKYFELGSTEK